MIDPVPTFAQPVVGFRVWKLARDGMLLPRTLSALQRLEVEPWQPGRNDARCMYLGRTRGPHSSPDQHCDCGLHAYHDVSQLTRAARADGLVAGAVTAWGDLQVHRGGFRAQHAQVVALAFPDSPGMAAPARAAARRYGVPLVTAAELQGCAAPYGAPLPASVRPARWKLPRAWRTGGRRHRRSAPGPSQGGRADHDGFIATQ